MSKKNKSNDNIFESKEVITEEVVENDTGESLPEIEPSNQPILIETVEQLKEFVKSQPIYINAKFSDQIIEIGYTFLATGEQNILSVSNGRMNLLQGRLYYIPIDKGNINSDEYNIKVHSDASSRFDIRFVRDGLAAVVPILHNAILKTGERLCVLTPLI